MIDWLEYDGPALEIPTRVVIIRAKIRFMIDIFGNGVDHEREALS